jgi:hypothetical protein
LFLLRKERKIKIIFSDFTESIAQINIENALVELKIQLIITSNFQQENCIKNDNVKHIICRSFDDIRTQDNFQRFQLQNV